MSQEVDERVVQMRFDNAQFEKNVHQSIQSLDKLNDSLQLEGAEKGFEKISDASAKVDFDEMQGALENLNSKFSAVEVMGVAALTHITRQAVDTGEKLVKSLSLDQVTSGWNKYAQKTASVQTIMNATGKSITKVNSYLDKLMWFSDETSYGFTDMTSALSTLTAAGGDIEKMIPMIMGMANATAYAGKGAAEFQRVIYNLAQSYGTGAIQLIDWKSVEQAGVASQQLKQLLIDTGVSLGKIKEGDVTTGTFDNSLQKKWADKEVMEAAFGKYAEFSEAVKKMVDANPGMLATQAIDALADQYDEVAVKAFKAAQEAKSFSEAVDATKDAVSSGWMETFNILFGNYEEAKGFWSDLAEEFWTMFAGGAAGRNNWLKSAFDSGLDQLLGTDGFGEAGDAYTNLLRKAMVNEGVLTEEAIEDAGSFQKALEESGVTAQQLYDVIGGAAEHYAQRAALSDEELDKLGLDRDKVETLANAYADMAEKIQNGSVNLEDLAGKMNQLSGREHFFGGILNVLEGINSVMTPIRDAFGDVFMTDGSPLYNFLKGFDELTGKLVLSEETGEKVQKVFTGVFRVLSIGLKGVKTVGKTALTILEKLLDLLSPLGDLLLNIGSYMGNLLTWVDVSLGQAESLSDVIGILAGAVGALLQPLYELWQGFKTFVRGGNLDEAKQKFGTFGTVVNTVSGVLEKFKIGSVSAGSVIGTAFQILGGILLTAFDGVGGMISRAFGGFKGAGETVSEFAGTKVPMLENIRDVVLSLPEKAEAVLKDFGGTLSGIMTNITSACRTALEAVKDFFDLEDGIDIYRLLALIDVGALAAAIYGATVLLKKASDNLKNTFANPVADFLNAMTGAVKSWTASHTTNNLATAAKAIATAVGIISVSMYLLSRIDDPMKAAQALDSVMMELFGVVAALKVLAMTDLTGLDSAKLIGTIASISLGMTVLAGAFTKMGKMHSYQVENGMKAISRVASVLMGMVGMLTMFNTYGEGTGGAGAFVAAAAAVDMIALALIPLAKAEANGLDIDGAVEAINGVAIAMSILTVAAGFAQKLAGTANVKTLDKIALYLAKMAGVVLAINGVASALLVTAGAVAVFALMGDKVYNGLIGAGIALAEIAVVLASLYSTDLKPKKLVSAAKAMLIASSSVVVLAEAVKIMTNAMGTDGSGAGFAGVTIGLIELAGAIYLLGKHAPESTAAAVAMVAMGAALIEMALAIKMLADVPFETIMVNLGLLAVGLLALVGVCVILPEASLGLLSMAKACMMMATALLLLAPACYLLSGLSLDQALAGFTGMLAIFVGLGLIGAAPAIATGLTVFAASLVNLGKAFSAFAGGLVKLSIAAGILAVLSLLADPVCPAIITAGLDIQAALETIIDVICNTINDKADVIAQAIANLIIIVLDSTIQVLSWAWEQLKAWVGEKGSEVSKLVNPLDPTSWVDTFTAKDRPFGMILNGITDPFLAPFGTSLDEIGNQIEDSMSGSKQAVEDTTKALEENQKQVEDSAAAVQKANEQTEEAADATNVMTIAQKQNTDKLYELTTETGEVRYADEEWLKATLNSTDAMNDAANASGTAAGVVSGNAARVDTGMTAIKAKTSDVNKTVEETTTKAVEQAQESTETSGGNLGQWLYDGLISKIEVLFPGAGDKIQNAINSAVSSVQIPEIAGAENIVPNIAGGAKELWKNLGGTGLKDEDYDEEAKKDPDDDKTPTGSGGTTKTKSSGTKKTVAQQITEKYKDQLAANKTAREVLDSEYELWQAENQYSADEDTLLSKKMENAAAEITNQTDRVAIAQAKYDEMVKRWGADKSETKEAYADLLDEQVSLAKLKADQYTDLFSDVTKRYDTDLDTLEKEYSLWTAQNDNTASKLDKIDKETEYQKDELEVKLKKEAKAKEQYELLAEKFGKADLRTIEAKNDWLDAQTESLELQNEIAKQGLNRLDAQLEIISDAQSRMQNRMDLLTSIYDDGSLSDRADAYKQAVEEYGENSAEARKAKYQGITTSILGTVEALQNMNAELKTTYELQKALDEDAAKGPTDKSKMSEEERQDYEDKLLSSRSSMVSFAGALADAMDLDDTAKKAVVKFANAIQKNWKPIQDGMTAMMEKLTAGMSDGTKDTLQKAFGAAFSDEGIEIGTEFLSAITSAMQGDYAGALISAVTGVIDLMSTDAGQQLMESAGNLIAQMLAGFQNGNSQLSGLVNGEGGMVDIVTKGLGAISTAMQSGEGIGGIVSSVGGMLQGLGGVLMSFLAEFWWVFAIIAAIAAVIGTVAWVSSKKKKHETNVSEDVGAEIDKGIADGVKEDAPLIDDAVDQVTEDAAKIAEGALGTISRVMGDEYDYEPQITPVVDLTNVLEGADEIDNAFADTKSLSLDGDISRNLANQIDAEVQLQNAQKNAGNGDTLNAINALAGHMDGIAEGIKGMKLTINGRKTIGWIDDSMGRVTGAKTR